MAAFFIIHISYLGLAIYSVKIDISSTIAFLGYFDYRRFLVCHTIL